MCGAQAHVRFGSQAHILRCKTACPRTHPKCGHHAGATKECPLCAKSHSRHFITFPVQGRRHQARSLSSTGWHGHSQASSNHLTFLVGQAIKKSGRRPARRRRSWLVRPETTIRDSENSSMRLEGLASRRECLLRRNSTSPRHQRFPLRQT